MATAAIGERRRVLRVITRLNIGGPAQHALLLSKALAEDYETVLAAGRVGPGEGELTDPEVPVRAVPLLRPVDPIQDTIALMRLRRLVTQTAPSIVHTHMAKAGTIGRLAALSHQSRPRIVHTFHGHVLDGYFRRGTQRFFLETERWLARHTDLLLTVSPQIRESLLDLGVGRPEQYRVVPLGLDLSSFLTVDRPRGLLRSRLNLAWETPLVGTVGRLVPIKDHTTLLRAMARLDGTHLAVIGDGELRPVLAKLARQLGVDKRVHFLGWCRDVAAAVSDLDVVVLTSRNEGTPVALIEALACARPVVATDVGGVRFVVQDGVSGYVVPPGDHEAIAAALARILAARPLQQAMGGAGRRFVEPRFGAERLARDMSSLYAELLAPGPPSRWTFAGARRPRACP